MNMVMYNENRTRIHLRNVELAPSEQISSLPHTKSVRLALPPPQILQLSSMTPPSLSSRCSCPQPHHPTQKGN